MQLRTYPWKTRPLKKSFFCNFPNHCNVTIAGIHPLPKSIKTSLCDEVPDKGFSRTACVRKWGYITISPGDHTAC